MNPMFAHWRTPSHPPADEMQEAGSESLGVAIGQNGGFPARNAARRSKDAQRRPNAA